MHAFLSNLANRQTDRQTRANVGGKIYVQILIQPHILVVRLRLLSAEGDRLNLLLTVIVPCVDNTKFEEQAGQLRYSCFISNRP